MTKSKNRALIGILLIVAVFFVILIGFSMITVNSLKEFGNIDISKGSGSIVVVEVEGVIMKSKKTIRKLMRAEKDKKTKAIIVRIESPGGAVGPTQEIYEEMKRIDKKIPVYASFGSVAASGGYYLGAAARKIYANAGTITGSIGVIMQFMNMSKLYEFAKLKPTNVKSGKYKDIGSPNRKMTPEEQDLLQGMIARVHGQFMDDIVKTRGKKLKGNIKDLAQGQIYSGDYALELGLVDEIAGLWEAGRRIHKELKLTGEFGLKFIKLKKKFSFMDMMNNVENAIESIRWGALAQNIPLFMSIL